MCLATGVGLEPTAYRLEVCRSIQLSYTVCVFYAHAAVPEVGLEPTTTRLRALRSTD